jgi:predicted aconitase with swiveling domain
MGLPVSALDAYSAGEARGPAGVGLPADQHDPVVGECLAGRIIELPPQLRRPGSSSTTSDTTVSPVQANTCAVPDALATSETSSVSPLSVGIPSKRTR